MIDIINSLYDRYISLYEIYYLIVFILNICHMFYYVSFTHIVSPIICDFINQVKYIYVNICCILCSHVIFWFDEILFFYFLLL